MTTEIRTASVTDALERGCNAPSTHTARSVFNVPHERTVSDQSTFILYLKSLQTHNEMLMCNFPWTQGNAKVTVKLSDCC